MRADRPPLSIEWGKLLLLGITIVGGFTLLVIALVAELEADRFAAVLALATGQIAGAVGYLTGNGRLISKGEQPVAALSIRRPAATITLASVHNATTAALEDELERLAELTRTGGLSAGDAAHLAAITLELEHRGRIITTP